MSGPMLGSASDTGRNLAVIAAGGTGGHMFPAQALAEELVGRGWQVALITDRRGAGWIEAARAHNGVLSAIAIHVLPAEQLGGGIVRKAQGAVALLRSFLAARELLRRLRPAVAVGFGGYATLPTIYVASREHIPTVIHEQNALLGRANRMLAARVRAIATSFDHVARLKAGAHRIVLTGNPVRPAISAVGLDPYRAPDATERIRLLVFGGSQGASVFGRIVPPALAKLPPALQSRLAVVQQCRPADLESVREIYAAAGIEAELAPFFADVPERFRRAHLIVARAGASTVAEIQAVGRPAILVPYPHAADDHQTFNARVMQHAGAGWLMPERYFTIDNLVLALERLFKPDNETLNELAGLARALSRTDAARRLAELVASVAGHDRLERAA